MSEAVEPSEGKRKQTQDHMGASEGSSRDRDAHRRSRSRSNPHRLAIRRPDRPVMTKADAAAMPVRLRRPPASEPPYDPAFSGPSAPARRTAAPVGVRPERDPATAAGACSRGRPGRRRSAGGRERTALRPHLPGGPQRLPPRQSPAHPRRTGRVQHGGEPTEPAAQRSRPLRPGAPISTLAAAGASAGRRAGQPTVSGPRNAGTPATARSSPTHGWGRPIRRAAHQRPAATRPVRLNRSGCCGCV